MEDLARVYAAALEALRTGQAAAVATVVEASGSTPRGVGAKMLVYPEGGIVGTVGGGGLEALVIEAAQAALEAGQPRELDYRGGDEAHICGGDMRIFIEVLLPRWTLLIIGAGHIGQALAELGAFLGYRVAVLDEREHFVTPERFPHANVRLTGALDEQLRSFPVTPRTCAVFVTPHHSRDERGLAVLAQHEPAYVGLLGGKRRTEATFERARALGVPEPFLARIHTPVGLDIGAETPREIALCIAAELVAVQRGG